MQNQQEILVGYAIFYLTQNYLSFILSKAEKNILNQEVWSWKPNNYNAFLWKQIFSKMKDSSCKILYLNKLQIPFIVKNIQHINFTQLRQLILDSNNIVNVENLQFLDMKKLVYLNLSQNQICQLSFFHKQSMPSIQKIDVQLNYIKSIESLNKCLLSFNQRCQRLIF